MVVGTELERARRAEERLREAERYLEEGAAELQVGSSAEGAHREIIINATEAAQKALDALTRWRRELV